MPVTTSATNQAAFEAPKDRFAWYSEKPINKYEPAIINANGYIEPATATSLTDTVQFIGICQYTAENEGDMSTIVKGSFPAVADAAIAAGALIEVTDNTVTINETVYHTVKASASTGKITDTKVIGTAITPAAAKGDLVTVLIK